MKVSIRSNDVVHMKIDTLTATGRQDGVLYRGVRFAPDRAAEMIFWERVGADTLRPMLRRALAALDIAHRGSPSADTVLKSAECAHDTGGKATPAYPSWEEQAARRKEAEARAAEGQRALYEAACASPADAVTREFAAKLHEAARQPNLTTGYALYLEAVGIPMKLAKAIATSALGPNDINPFIR